MIDHRFLAGLHARRGSMPYGDAVDLAMSLGIDPTDISAFIGDQMHKGYISGDTSAYGVLRLTTAGRIFLMEAQERELESANQKLEKLQQLADQRAQLVADKRSDRRFQILNTLLSTLLGFLLGLIAEHFTGIIDLIARLLG